MPAGAPQSVLARSAAEVGQAAPLSPEARSLLRPQQTSRQFLDELRSVAQVVILSDTFEQFAAPFMRQLGMPTILCHSLVVADDRIVDYRLRQADQKRHAVEAFRGLNYRVIAAGDSYNDSSMLGAADAGFWFRAPEAIAAQFPRFPAVDTYRDLFAAITASMSDFIV